MTLSMTTRGRSWRRSAISCTAMRPVAQELERSNTYPEKLIDQMKQLGIFGLVIPEPYG